MTLEGRAVTIEDDPSFEDIDKISIHHTGGSFPLRESGRVSAWIDVDSWHKWR